MFRVTLPADEVKLHAICVEAIERLVECQEVSVDKFYFPFWKSSGEYLDGVKRWKDGQYFPDGVPDAKGGES